MKKVISIILLCVLIVFCFVGCEPDNNQGRIDEQKTKIAADQLQKNQPTPTDIDYSLERYNLIRRAYWVNGMREKAVNLVCEAEKPMGYITIISGNLILGTFTVDGKVSSLNSFLTANYQYYYQYSDGSFGQTQLSNPMEMADIDGSFGENDGGVFWFTVDGKYCEWNGQYIYTDIPMMIDQPAIRYITEEND